MLQDVSKLASGAALGRRDLCSRKLEKCEFYGLNLVVLRESCQEARLMQESSVHRRKIPELGELTTSQ